MGEVVNLRQMRKTRDRVQKASQAAENRVKHGRSKAEKALEQARRDAARRTLDNHQREDGDRFASGQSDLNSGE